MIRWFINLFPRQFPAFKPGVFYDEELRLTEIILEDTFIVWCPWGPLKGHAVDCGYDDDDRLVGIRIWDDVRKRGDRQTIAIVRGAEMLEELYGKGSKAPRDGK